MTDPTHYRPEELIDSRQREALARYLVVHPLICDAFLERRRAIAENEGELEHKRQMALDLVEWLERRLPELRSKMNQSYRHHLKRRAEIMSRG